MLHLLTRGKTNDKHSNQEIASQLISAHLCVVMTYSSTSK